MNALPPTTCPACLAVRLSQGFEVVVDPIQPLCSTCAEHKKARDFYASEPYQTWLVTKPEGQTMEESIEWMKVNPPPQPAE